MGTRERKRRIAPSGCEPPFPVMSLPLSLLGRCFRLLFRRLVGLLFLGLLLGLGLVGRRI